MIEGEKEEKKERQEGREREREGTKECGGTATLPFFFLNSPIQEGPAGGNT
jgi:hypothetical protein